jgi:hypothetical protein
MSIALQTALSTLAAGLSTQFLHPRVKKKDKPGHFSGD